MKSEVRVRVGVVAGDPLRALGLLVILEESLGLQAVELTLEGIAAEKKLGALLIDVRSAGPGLTEIIAHLHKERPALKIVVIGETPNADLIQSVIGAGAKGFLLETSDEREIFMAMEVVLDGSVWAPRKVLARLIDAAGGVAAGRPGGDGVVEKMTPREMDVLRLLMDGNTNRQIGAAMGIDEVTVKAHLGRMLRKTGASNRVELTLRAMEEGKSKS